MVASLTKSAGALVRFPHVKRWGVLVEQWSSTARAYFKCCSLPKTLVYFCLVGFLGLVVHVSVSSNFFISNSIIYIYMEYDASNFEWNLKVPYGLDRFCMYIDVAGIDLLERVTPGRL